MNRGLVSLVSSFGIGRALTMMTAPYLSNRKKESAAVEEAVFEDSDNFAITQIIAGPGSKIRIPPELMPDEETALRYFDVYFNNIHPYVPVLNKTLFYQQWHGDREAISPLILEAMFAHAGKLEDEPSQGQQWLALATREFCRPVRSSKLC